MKFAAYSGQPGSITRILPSTLGNEEESVDSTQWALQRFQLAKRPSSKGRVKGAAFTSQLTGVIPSSFPLDQMIQ